MFPTQEIDLNAIVNKETTESPAGKKSFKFDFNTGDFIIKDGNAVVIDGFEALKQWIDKILRTELNRYKIYEKGYGATLLDYLTSGLPLPFVKSEVEREIKEVVLKNTDIKSISDVVFTREKRTLSVRFTVNSIYGTFESEVFI